MHGRRRFMGGLILAVWVTTVGWQVRREYFKPELARLTEAALSLAPGVEFYTLELGGRAVGLATSKLDTTATGYELEDYMSLELPALGQTGTAVVRSHVSLAPSLSMTSFDFSLDSEVGRFAAHGIVVGDTVLDVSIEAGADAAQAVSYRFEQPPIFAAVLPIRVALGEGLEVGQRLRMPVFDPSSLSTRTVEVQVLEYDTLAVPDSASLNAAGRWVPAHYDLIPAWRVAEVFGGIRVESWIDDDGRIVESASPLGFAMRRTEYELARQAVEDVRGNPGRSLDDDVILSTAVQSNVDLGNVEVHDELRFRLTGVDLAGFQLQGGRQSLHGDTLVIRREDWKTLEPGYSLPYKRMDLAEALEPEPLIQSDHPRIVERARQLTNWNTQWAHDPKIAARRLTSAVHHMLDKQVTFSVPSALQVLDSGQGDCNEHTVLFVALARSLGLPARTAVGLVYVEGAFYYHAWPEVWLGEWVAVDPTFGQYPADAAHIRFVVGGLAQQVEIVRLIGRLEIEVLDATGAARADQS